MFDRKNILTMEKLNQYIHISNIICRWPIALKLTSIIGIVSYWIICIYPTSIINLQLSVIIGVYLLVLIAFTESIVSSILSGTVIIRLVTPLETHKEKIISIHTLSMESTHSNNLCERMRLLCAESDQIKEYAIRVLQSGRELLYGDYLLCCEWIAEIRQSKYDKQLSDSLLVSCKSLHSILMDSK